jgi:osmoprotectant transport system ATP-binding protein
MSAIKFINVSKQFRGTPRPAVADCSLEIEAGSFVVLLGPSGCGKTTLLKMVNRLHEPTSGTISLEGSDVRQFKVTSLRQQIGYVIQQVGLFPHMTVAQNIGVVPRLLGWSREQTDQRVDELLDLIHLAPDEYRNRYPAQLSGGQQQRVGLARALAGDPKVLLMDEPFGAIDAITRTSLQDEMVRLQHHLKKTILFVTHDVEEALRLADKIVVMEMGTVAQYDTPFNILTRPASPFVHTLVGADDMLRQLSQLPVRSVMVDLPDNYQRNGEPTVASDSDLRNALSTLLRTGARVLAVLEDQAVVGLLSLEHIRERASTYANPAHG